MIHGAIIPHLFFIEALMSSPDKAGSVIGFCHYFGSEPNKEILIEFLNDLFDGERRFETLEYSPNEHNGDDKEDKRVIFDLYCRGNNWEARSSL